MDLVGSTPPGSMKTVQQIIDELSAFPPDAKAAAYVAEDCGLVVYKPSHGKYANWDVRSNHADEPLGFVRAYYDDAGRPENPEDGYDISSNYAEGIIAAYENGAITEANAVYELFDRAVYHELPDEWVERVWRHVGSLPVTDEGWSKMVFAEMWCGTGSPPTQEEYRARAKEQAAYWRQAFGNPM